MASASHLWPPVCCTKSPAVSVYYHCYIAVVVDVMKFIAVDIIKFMLLTRARIL